jgi:DNA invertase Pin-like site-specific DNA recombinase
MGKIDASHVQRRACVYVRQSSMAQVQHHRESTQRQYNLRERAMALGWAADQVEVIDEDQGKSGASANGRGGFQRLVAAVGLGEVGAVFGLEVSRLARSCSDWYRLLEISALSQTLIIDEDGVYDPTQYNDRLLLGLKGTLSEAELHFIKQRMMGARRQKAGRRQLRIRLPVGYVWGEGEGVRMDPDERVQEAIHLFFRSFERLGSLGAVARYYEANRLLFPRRDGWGDPQAVLTWGQLAISRTATLLHNPIYAGVYAYDRNSGKEVDPEEPLSGGRILMRDSHPGYIAWQQYEANCTRQLCNRQVYRGMRNKGTPREGRSLLQGILLCAGCGRHMMVLYTPGRDDIYICRSQKTHRVCQRVNARYVEPLLEKELLNALSDQQLQLAVGTMSKLQQRGEEIQRQWEKRLEAARYQVEKAARRYHQVEPENRLVARTLEKEWNDSLEELDQLQREYRRVSQQPPCAMTAEQERKVMALAHDIPKLWRAPTTTNNQKKQLLRLLIEDIAIRTVDEPWCLDVSIHWKTGVVSRHTAQRILPSPQQTPSEAVSRIAELYRDYSDEETARILNAEGLRTGYGRPFTTGSVVHIRTRRKFRKRL